MDISIPADVVFHRVTMPSGGTIGMGWHHKPVEVSKSSVTSHAETKIAGITIAGRLVTQHSIEIEIFVAPKKNKGWILGLGSELKKKDVVDFMNFVSSLRPCRSTDGGGQECYPDQEFTEVLMRNLSGVVDRVGKMAWNKAR